MLDKDFLTRKIKMIQEDIAKLEKLGHFTFDELMQDEMRWNAAERYLEKIVTRAIDINRHIIGEIGTGIENIKGYEDTFNALAVLGVYDSDFAKKIAPSAGLRNRLVHEYNSTDDRIIYNSVSDALGQYTQYCDAILKFIEK